VADILELLASGLSEEEILDEHPILEREDIKAAMIFADLQESDVDEWESY